MNKLAQNVTNIVGENGKIWIKSLPGVIKILAKHWNLSNLIPVDNMSFHYVVKAIRDNSQPVVLKIGYDENITKAERQALMYFDSDASIPLIDYSEQYNALLLKQAIPGISLKSFYPINDKFVIDCYVNTIIRLHNKSLSNNSFSHISDWLESLDGFKSDQISKYLLEKAICLKNELLSSMQKDMVLHGDLHHDNILKDGDLWVAIDPKGVIGELEFEIAAFNFIHNTELTSNYEVNKLFINRIKTIATKLNLNAERIRIWVLVRLVLSAVWCIEDNGYPNPFLKLAGMLMSDKGR